MTFDIRSISADPDVRHMAKLDAKIEKNQKRRKKRETARGSIMYAIHQRVHQESITNGELDWIALVMGLYLPIVASECRSDFYHPFGMIASQLVKRGYAERFMHVLNMRMQEAKEREAET